MTTIVAHYQPDVHFIVARSSANMQNRKGGDGSLLRRDVGAFAASAMSAGTIAPRRCGCCGPVPDGDARNRAVLNSAAWLITQRSRVHVRESNPAPATRKLQVRGLIAGERSGLSDRLSAVRPWDLAPERGTGRAGSGENSTAGRASRRTQRLGRDHNCFHGDGDGNGAAGRGARVCRDPGGDRRSRAGAAEWEQRKAERRQAFAEHRDPGRWCSPSQGVAAGNGRVGDAIEETRAEQIEAAFHEPYTYTQVHTAGFYDDAGSCEQCDTAYCYRHRQGGLEVALVVVLTRPIGPGRALVSSTASGARNGMPCQWRVMPPSGRAKIRCLAGRPGRGQLRWRGLPRRAAAGPRRAVSGGRRRRGRDR